MYEKTIARRIKKNRLIEKKTHAKGDTNKYAICHF